MNCLHGRTRISVYLSAHSGYTHESLADQDVIIFYRILFLFQAWFFTVIEGSYFDRTSIVPLFPYVDAHRGQALQKTVSAPGHHHTCSVFYSDVN